MTGAGPCRGCGNATTTTVLDLGRVPAGDHFPAATAAITAAETAHPLAMALCPVCALAQLVADDTGPEEPRGIEPQALRDQAAAAVGVATAAGVLDGAATVREFPSPHGGSWSPLLVARGIREVPAGPADVVLDSFGLMHAADQRAAFRDRARAVGPGGVALLQFHSLAAILADGQWNALRHGHYAYYSLTAMVRMLAAVEMTVTHAWRFDLYGGTVLVAARHGRPRPAGGTVAAILAAERAAGITEAATIGTLQRCADHDARVLHAELQSARAAGYTVWAYGAASRAVALLHRARVDADLLPAVADASSAKHGRRMPGTDVPIVAPATLVAARPDRVLLTLPDLLPELDRALPELTGRWVTDPARLRAPSAQ